jgi:hypothetical protein
MDDFQTQLAATINRALNSAIDIKVAQATAPKLTPVDTTSTALLKPGGPAASVPTLQSLAPWLLIGGAVLFLLVRAGRG